MTVKNIDHLRVQVELLKHCKEKMAALKELQDKAKEAVQDELGDATDGTVDGEIVVTWHSHKRRALDQKALKADHPEIVEEYMTTTVVRRFEIVDD